MTRGNSVASHEAVARLYLRGRSQEEIGQELGLSRQAVTRAVKRLHDGWRKDQLANVNERLGMELAKIDLLEATYWRAWEGSCERSGSRAGNPAYLKGVERCITRRCQLLGLDRRVERGGVYQPVKTVQILVDRKAAEEVEVLNRTRYNTGNGGGQVAEHDGGQPDPEP